MNQAIQDAVTRLAADGEHVHLLSVLSRFGYTRETEADLVARLKAMSAYRHLFREPVR